MNVQPSANSGRTVAELLKHDSAQLQAALDIDAASARIEVQCLLQAALQVSRSWLLTYPDYSFDAVQRAHYEALFERRMRGEPIAYILGEREFYGLNFKVTPATLIPRPDTELLVELALQRIPQHGRVLDLGTGSGAIALSIAHARPDVEVTATDASAEALAVARENAGRLGIGNVRLLHSDWFAALNGERFDIIVSNPPYIASGDAHLRQGDLRFEPATALASGSDGLEDIRRIAAAVPAHLQPGGWVLLEHGYDQAASVRELLQQAGLAGVFSACDLAGIERVSGARRKGIADVI